MKSAGSRGPFRLRQPRHVGNLSRVCLGWVAHPDPDNVPFFSNRIAAHLGAGRDLVSVRKLDTFAVHVELEPMVTAGEIVAGNLAEREWRGAVTAAVL